MSFHPTHTTANEILAVYLAVRGFVPIEVKEVPTFVNNDYWPPGFHDPDDAIGSHAVFIFVESPELLKAVQDFEGLPSGSDWTEVIRQASVHGSADSGGRGRQRRTRGGRRQRTERGEP